MKYPMIDFGRFARPIWKLLGLILVGFIFAPTSVEATTRESIFQIQQVLESRIAPIIRAIDPAALVFVRVKTVIKDSAPLPGTPFVVQDLTLKDATGDIQIEKVEINILTRKPKFSKTITSLIHEISDGLGPVDLRVQKLPTELRPKAEAPPKPPPAPPKRAPGFLPWLVESLRDPMAIPIAFLAFGLMMLISFQWGTFRLGRVVKSGLASLATSVENGGASSAAVSTAMAGGSAAGAEATSSLSAGGSGSDAASDLLAGLPAEGLVAILADCYWCEYDAYAAYLWKRIPVEKRKDLLLQVDFLSEYAAYLTGMREQTLGAEQEPCYLQPLPIWHIDNATLTGVVRSNPQLRFRISSLRVARLALQPRERVDIIRSGISSAPMALPDFKGFPASAKRQLKMRTEIPLNTVAEEKEIMALPNLSIDIMESVPSLAWLAGLPEAVVREVLGGFTARDLAAAWVGPEEILTKLAGFLPEKKQAMLKSYSSQVVPSRNSPVFRTLHQRSIALLRNPAPAVAAPTAKAA